jgi:hypothetical protein
MFVVSKRRAFGHHQSTSRETGAEIRFVVYATGKLPKSVAKAGGPGGNEYHSSGRDGWAKLRKDKSSRETVIHPMRVAARCTVP